MQRCSVHRECSSTVECIQSLEKPCKSQLRMLCAVHMLGAKDKEAMSRVVVAEKVK